MEGSIALADAAREDVGNILHLEHVNVQVSDLRLATLFYVAGMGFTRDPHFVVGVENQWINVGETQFHLPVREPQVLRGRVGLVLPDLEALEARLHAVAPQLAGSRFAWRRDESGVAVTCPWGNRLHCFLPSAEHPGMRLGIAYVQFDVPVGASAGIGRFYEQVMEAPVTRHERNGLACASVAIGSSQKLLFEESAQPLPAYDGHHIAIYVARFSRAFAWLQQRGRLTEGVQRHQYRFQDLLDPETGEPLFELEHEVRSFRHPMFLRPLINRDPALTARSYSADDRPAPQPRWGP